jgi:hypothetical protein
MTTRRSILVAAIMGVGLGGAALGGAGCGVKDRTEGRLDLADAELAIDQQDGVHHELSLTAAGAVAWDGKPLVTITRNGVLRAGTRTLAKIDKYGAVTIGGQPTNLVVTKDGALQLDGQDELTIDRDGVVAGTLVDTIDHPAMKLDGAKLTYAGPPAARQAVLLGFAAVIIPSLAPPAPAAAATP